MGKIEFSNCQDVRNQKKIQELDCPRCHEPGGIEAFVKDGILAEDGVCDNCGYLLPECPAGPATVPDYNPLRA